MNIFGFLPIVIGTLNLIYIFLLHKKTKSCTIKTYAKFLYVIETQEEKKKRKNLYYFEYVYFGQTFVSKFKKNELKILKQKPIKNNYYEMWINPQKPSICFFDKNIIKLNIFKIIISVLLIIVGIAIL